MEDRQKKVQKVIAERKKKVEKQFYISFHGQIRKNAGQALGFNVINCP